MSAWIRLLLGLGPEEVPPGGVTRFEFAGMPHGWWAVIAFIVLVLAVALIVLLYRRETEVGRLRKSVLAALRLLALALVVLVILNPRLAVEIQARRPARTILLVDGSGSMASVDRYERGEALAIGQASGLDVPLRGRAGTAGDASRAALAAGAIERSGLAAKLAKSNRVSAYVFDDDLTASDPGALPAKARKAAGDGKATWIGSALRGALDAAGPELVAGVVLLSDGRSNGGDSLAGAKAELASRGIPLHAVGVGKLETRKNIAIEELTAPEIAEAGFPIRLRVRVRGNGYPGDVELQLLRASMGKGSGEGAYEKVGGETVSLGEFSGEAVLNLSDIPPGDGRWRYRAEVPAQPGEESQRDNIRTADVLVASDACRVLLISGGPSFEYRHLRNFFVRDDGIQVSCWLQSADPKFPQEGDLPIKSLPATDVALRPFEVVVLLDPDPEDLPVGFGAALDRMVTEWGSGLAFVAGEHHTSGLAASAEGRRIANLLPIALRSADPGHDHRTPWRPQVTAPGLSHALLQILSTPAESREMWSVLPPFYFRYPAGPLKPAASSLWDAGGSTAMAVHQAGAGRVLFIGTDDLYHWREYREGIHERFWSGAARFLALGRKLTGTRKASIATDRERYRLGEEVVIEAHLLDEKHEPVMAPRIPASIEGIETEGGGKAGGGNGGNGGDGGTGGGPAGAGDPPPRRELFLEGVKERPGWFRGRLKTEAAGSFRVSLAEASESAPAVFKVSPPSSEGDDTSPDFAALEDLARSTGGSFGLLGSIGEVPARIPDRTVVEVLGRKTATVWDSAALLLAFSGALILEWILRKRWRLC
jgi:hypothetical protein